MDSMRIEGLESVNRLSQRMQKFEGDLDEVFGRALYKAAGVVADELKSQAQTIPTQDEDVWGTRNHPRIGVTPEQKSRIVSSMGIAHHRKTGNGVETSVGFKGDGAKYARRVNSGTSYMKKTPFVRRAERAAKAKAIQAAETEALKEINRILGD